MLADGVIERSASAWSSAPVIVKKADGSNRFCIDYRDLNKVTKKDAYPVPNIDHILDKLRRARYITTIDLKSAYFQIKMEESSKKFTAFAIPGSGLYQFLRLPYGLCNAPASFQRLIDALFGPEFEPHVFGYLDDIIIVTESFDEHMKWLEIVLTKLRDAGLTVNRKKCDFCCSRVKYLGYVLDSNGLRVDSEKVQPVLRYPAPTNVKELRRFLGMVGWYARFIPNDSDLKKPLLELLHKDAEWRWTREHQSAFEALKRAITEAPVLARPDFSKPFVVQCDASDVAIGGVLTQVHEDGEHPIVYVSRVLTPAERNYNTSEKECLALLWAIKKLRPYLEGYRFVAITDHSALQYLRNLKEPTGRLARWALEMQQWDFEVVHRKGKYNELPDALSRVCEIESNDDVVESANVGTMNVCDIDDEAYSARIEEVLTSPERWRNCRRNPKVDVGDLKPYKTSEEKQNRREGEPPRAAGYRTEAWAVAVVEERPSPPAQAQGPPAASWRREPRQQVYPEQYRAPQLSELEMYRRVMERQAQIEAARAEHQRAVEEAYAIELIRARAFARTGPYHQWEGPPRDQR
uniref:Reverse transcriptase domain-containing protein n=1 Tax=Trichogramma kaykai TaxID=54128 RepID=A0ABD2XP31_9HYME